MGLMSKAKFKNVDFYRKIPKDMTEGTIPGSVISMLAALVIGLLLVSEVGSYLTPKFDTRVVIDRSADGEMMRINFNVSFPALSCEFASVDVGDAMGLNRFNLTKTVFKRAIDAKLNPLGPIQWERGHENRKEPEHADEAATAVAIKTVEEHAERKAAMPNSDRHAEGVFELVARSFEDEKKKAAVLLVNFYAPWCPWSRRLDPVWKASALEIHAKYPKDHANRVVVAEVDCTKHERLCREQHIQGYPSVRVYTKSHDALHRGYDHDHTSYHGDRTVEAITTFAEELLPAWKATDHKDTELAIRQPVETQTVKKIDGPGCSVTGFVLVKKVPGHLWVTATSKSHSFHAESMNMSHVVHHFYFGQQLTPQRKRYLDRFHSREKDPKGDWHDKLAGGTFTSEEDNVTHEHYLQTVLTTIKPSGSPAPFNVYEYTQHSHSLRSEKELPRAKFHFDPSPVQISVSEERQKFYHFITTLMAIVGGVYSVMGIADGFVHNSIQAWKKKELGKFG